MPSVPIEMPSRDADGVEAHADQAGGVDALLHLVAEVVQVHVAGVAFVPDGADADLGLVHVVGREAGGEEHRLAKRPGWWAG